MSAITTDAPSSLTLLHRPVGHPSYPVFLRSPAGQSLSSEALAKDYREAHRLGIEPAKAALARQLYGDERHHRPIRAIAQRMDPDGRPDSEVVDLFNHALTYIDKKLLSEDGAYAETNWSGFCYQPTVDAWRNLFGRDGQRANAGHSDYVTTDRSILDTVSMVGFRPPSPSDPDTLVALEAVVANAIADMDGELSVVAADQFGADPSYVSGTKLSRVEGKKSLLDQLGWTSEKRRKVYDLRDEARTLVAAALIRAVEDDRIDIDLSAARGWLDRKQNK